MEWYSENSLLPRCRAVATGHSHVAVLLLVFIGSHCADTAPSPADLPPSAPTVNDPGILPPTVAVDPTRQGVVKELYPDGAVHVEATYENGILNGRYRRFSPKGLIEEEAQYIQGRVDGLRKFYGKDGSLFQMSRYREGMLNGETRVLFPNGRTQVMGNFYNGLLKGELKAHYSNGKVRRYCTLRSGQIDGLIKTYTPSGQLIEEVQFDEVSGKGTSRSFNESVKLVVEFEFISPRTDANTPENWGAFGFSAQNGEEKFSELGQAIELRVFERRQKQGSFKEFEPDGSIKRSCLFENDTFKECAKEPPKS